ncbi:cytoplasmic dynein 2 light intermediate chain 1-like, partial [Lucilia sericata]
MSLVKELVLNSFHRMSVHFKTPPGEHFLRKLASMESDSNKKETIQDIAFKLAEEQLKLLQVENGPKERTVFILGSKGVGKTTAINTFFDREDTSKPTLALEYSYGRRTGHLQKQVLNIWELGSLHNSEQLLRVPLKSHGIVNFAAVIMLDLSQPRKLWSDLEAAYLGLKQGCQEIVSHQSQELTDLLYEKAKERVKKDHMDLNTLELMPFPIVLVGAKYDLFMGYEPELKKHICRCLRSVAHLIGASLLFYSSKIQKLAKTLRDTISHLGFGSPSNPFRTHNTDYNDALSIWFGTDSWQNISSLGAQNLQSIQTNLSTEVPQQLQQARDQPVLNDPAKDAGFRESIIDEMRAQKDKELERLIKEAQLRSQFQ